MHAVARRLAATLLATSLLALASVPAGAATDWEKQHPRRAEVNARLANQDRRIHQQVKDGNLTKAQAAGLHQEDRQIRQQERQMAKANGGHITRAEQKALNQEENAVSRQIGR